MKKISPLGIVLLLLLLFAPRQNDEDRPTTDTSSTVVTTHQPAQDNLERTSLLSGEPAREPQSAGSR